MGLVHVRRGGELAVQVDVAALQIWNRIPSYCDIESHMKGPLGCNARTLQGDPEGLGLGLVDLIWGVPRAGGPIHARCFIRATL